MSSDSLMVTLIQAENRNQEANEKADYQMNFTVCLDVGSQTNAIFCKFNKAVGSMNKESFDSMISAQKSSYNKKTGRNVFSESNTSINKRRRLDNNNKVGIFLYHQYILRDISHPRAR